MKVENKNKENVATGYETSFRGNCYTYRFIYHA